jgi:glycosyltransferase involved in cell wall biosynthesis
VHLTMNTVSLIGSVSRQAGGLFESVRRLHQELVGNSETLKQRKDEVIDQGLRAINVGVLGLRDEFTSLDLADWDPVPVRTFEICGPRTFGYAPGLYRVLKRTNPDLVHVHGLWQFSSIATVRWHYRSRRPYVVSPHGMLDPWALTNSGCKKRMAWFAYERHHLKKAGCIRALCQSEAESIRALGLSNPICLIPNGVALPEQTQCPATHCAMENGQTSLPPKTLLYLGRIHPKKGLAALLRAWAKAQPQSGDWVLRIVGWDQNGHERQLKQLARDLGILRDNAASGHQARASVFFSGPKFGAAKRQCLGQCDAVVLPSYSEGLPMTILEAWANAKPVLLTPQCNLPEGITAGAAIPIDPNPEAIVAGLQQLFQTDRAALKSMGARGRELVKRQFSWPKIVAEVKAVYQWLDRGGPKPGCILTR